MCFARNARPAGIEHWCPCGESGREFGITTDVDGDVGTALMPMA